MVAQVIVLASVVVLAGCEPGGVDPTVSPMQPVGQTREIDFETDVGTWMSLDVSPDGQWIVFDLLGHVYRISTSGGEAEVLTQNSGVALNFHPAYSPDGSSIAYISDRSGQNNVWIMDADGANPRPTLVDADSRFTDPVWTPDGTGIVAVRAFPTPGRGWHRQTTSIWLLPLDEQEPQEVSSGHLTHYWAPTFAPDGRLYYHVSYSAGEGLGLLHAGHRIQRQDLPTGEVENVRRDEPVELSAEFQAALAGTGYAADVLGEEGATLNPEVSPDGRYLAFAQEVQGETFSYRGHDFGPRTALYVRDLDTGEERRVLDPAPKELTQMNAQYSYRVFPGFAWTPDSRAIVIAYGGKIRRIDVESGDAEIIPFTARVHRTISEQVRGNVQVDDNSFDARSLQWPASSPDGGRLAFVSVGRVWVVDLPDGTPQPLTPEMLPAFQLTPAWSPDGSEIAFSTWHDADGGHLWKVSASGGTPQRLTDEAGEYIYPVWTPDGESLVVTKGPGANEGQWNGWNAYGGWEAQRIPASGGEGSTIATFAMARRTSFGPDDRVYYQTQENAAAAGGLYLPFPSEEALRLSTVLVRSVDLNGGDPRDHLVFPPITAPGNRPVISPDGRWVAYEAGRSVYGAPLDGALDAGAPPEIDTNPNAQIAGRVRVGDRGGAYHRWRDVTTLEFFSGNRYVTHDFESGEASATEITLTIPRPRPRGTLALTGAKIITIGGGGVIERGTVVVDGSRIVCVGDCDSAGADSIIDVSGKVIIPGLIDLHAHHTGEASGIIPQRRSSSAAALAYGLTTIVDPATRSESAFPLAELIEAGLVTGPRTFSSAEFVLTQAYAWGDFLAINSAEDAAYHVDRRADWGAVTIKNYRQPGRAQHQLLMGAARERGISVTSEGGPLYFDIGLAMDGQTGWEHIVAPLPLYSDATTFFGQAEMVYSPTVIVAGHVNGAKEYFRPRQNLLGDEKLLRFLPRSRVVAQVESSPEMIPLSEVSFPIVSEGLADIVRAGGYGAIGEHGEQVGIGSHWELWAYAEALTPLEALTVATLHGAYFIGFDQETGSIEEGKLADLIVLNGDPLEDIQNTMDIAFVMKAGHLYDDETLDEIWPEERAFGHAPWR